MLTNTSRRWPRSGWATLEDAEYATRGQTLVFVLTYGLQLIIINLNASENSQEIFETLNARGTPLTATDLIKNFVFQRLGAEGTDTARAYAEDWPFDTSVLGNRNKRRSIQREQEMAVFLNQWLTATDR